MHGSQRILPRPRTGLHTFILGATGRVMGNGRAVIYGSPGYLHKRPVTSAWETCMETIPVGACFQSAWWCIAVAIVSTPKYGPIYIPRPGLRYMVHMIYIYMIYIYIHYWGEVNEGKKWCPIFQQKICVLRWDEIGNLIEVRYFPF